MLVSGACPPAPENHPLVKDKATPSTVSSQAIRFSLEAADHTALHLDHMLQCRCLSVPSKLSSVGPQRRALVGASNGFVHAGWRILQRKDKISKKSKKSKAKPSSCCVLSVSVSPDGERCLHLLACQLDHHQLLAPFRLRQCQ